ncbi:pilus assembly PilX N-terminal domain-containing protein [Desulfitibacter alkalitolerans]|uniref:pilus assembly PilX N-terminal domain-containing protein n=1 Tax=Desulfitibacter alkalitolerans TaxID=264641 RepID=UPI0004857146|nr:hypothetical protein [Desulfitibacter alkalitolerans]
MGEKGVAMLSVILVILITIVLLNGLMAMTITEVKISFNDQYAAQAIYLAEAGNELALDYLYDNPYFRGELLNLSAFDKPFYLGEGRINSIRVENSSPNVRITSTGEVEGIVRKAALLVRISLIQNEGEGEEVTEIFIDKIKWLYAF